MSTFQFIWQIIAIFGMVAALLFGLFSAPWYVLSGVLLVALAVTWRLMPPQDSCLAESDRSPQTAASDVASDRANALAVHPAPLQYRGAHYPLSPAKNVTQCPSALSYRGANYAVGQSAPSLTSQPPSQGHTEPNPPLLKYRGAKVQSSS